MPLEPTRVFRAHALATVAMMLLCWNVAYGQTRNSGLWRELPKPQSCPKRSRMLERAVTTWAESNQEWLYDYEFSPDGESILALSRKSTTGTKTAWQYRILQWSRAGQEPVVVLAFNSDAERIAVSPDGHIAVSRIERRKTDSERSFRDGNKGWEAFSIAEIYEAGSDQPVKTLEFSFSGPHQSLHYSGNGRWLSFGPVVYSTAS
jgi:WD40 repeat protein